MRELDLAYQRLVVFPEIGFRRDSALLLQRQVRLWRLRRFPILVVYLVEDDAIAILRVVHESRDWRDVEEVVLVADPIRRIKSRRVYENPWIEVFDDVVEFPTGARNQYGLIHVKTRAVGGIPIDDDGHTWLIGQYRYPTKDYSWEIPLGGAPIEEDPLVGAQRELREEAGIRAARWDHLLTVHTSNTLMDESAVVYVARGLEFGEAEPDETELLEVRRVPLSEAFRMARAGEITDAISVAALLKLELESNG